MQAFDRPDFLQALDRPGTLSVGADFGCSVCLARTASEVHAFVLGFHSMGWARDGLEIGSERQQVVVVGYKCTGGDTCKLHHI